MDYNIVWNNSAQLILLSKENITKWRYKGFESVKPYKEYEVKYINGINTEVGNYVKIQIKQHYFDLQDWKQVMGTNTSKLNAVVDESTLDE